MRTKLLSLKTLLVICLMAIVGGVETWADTYKYTSAKEDYSSYSSGIFSFVSGNVTWTGKTDYSKPSYQEARGTQFGTKSSTNCSLSLSTSDIVGTIQSIVVNTATARGCTVNLSVSVGGKEVGKKTLTGKSADYTFTPTITTSGEIVLSWSTAKGSVYLKSITITYTPSSGSSVAAPTFSEDSKSFSDKFDLTLSAGSDAAMIMYTTDGKTPSYKNNVGELYDEEAPISITHSTTVKAIAVSSKGEESDVVTKEYKLELPAPIISEETKTFTDPFTVSLSTKANAAEGILYTLDGTVPSRENNAATKTYAEPILISATTTLRAVSYATNGTTYEYSPIATATYTEQGDVPIVIWSEDWSGFSNNAKPTQGKNATYVFGGSKTAVKKGDLEHYAGGVTPEIMIANKGSLSITINDLKGVDNGLMFTFKTNKGDEPDFKVDVNNATILSNEVIGDSKDTRKYIMGLNEGATTITIKLDNQTGSNARVDDLELSTYSGVGSFKITEAGYGTYYSSKAYTMPKGVKGYTITGNEGTSLVMNEAYAAGDVVPAKTALVVEGAANKYYTLVAASTDLTPDNNKLHGSDEAETTYVDGTDVKYYKLSYNNEGNNLGFYWGSENGAAFTNGAHKAYLALNSETLLSQSRGFSLADLAHGVTTGINTTVKSATQSNFIYDLNGRRINSLNGAAKGVYIMNGQKVLVK